MSDDLTARPTLLHIDASIKADGSVSRELAGRFRAAWSAANPTGRIVHRDLGREPVPHVTEDGWLACLLPPSMHTPEQAAAWPVSEALITELEAADELLFAVPMYNLGIPSAFKAWIDHVTVVGRTLVMDGPGSIAGRKATVVTARGGAYGEGTPRAGLDHQEPYLRSWLTLLGITDVEFVHAELTLAATDPAMAHLVDIAEAVRAAAEERVVGRASGRGSTNLLSSSDPAVTSA